MKNIDLKKKYEKIWSDSAYEKFFSLEDQYFKNMMEMVNYMNNWKGLDVLEVGCGEGNLASIIASFSPKKIIAIDYSKEAIKTCKNKYNIKSLEFKAIDYRKLGKNKKFDVILLDGTLEHFDNPFKELDYLIKNHLKPKGVVINSCPSFLNLRGHVWMTLQLLFDVPMSLTDLHFLCPFDFKEFCDKKDYELEYKSVAQDWGCGEALLTDFDKRLRNALKDKGLPGNVDKLLDWLKKAIEYKNYDDHTGAIVIYRITRKVK